MNEKTHETYEEWLDIFKDVCMHLKYQGPFMADSWKSDWEKGRDPHDTAKEYINEMDS